MSKLFDMLKESATEDIFMTSDDARDSSIVVDGDIHPTGSLRADALRADVLATRELVREIGAQKEISRAMLERTPSNLHEAILDKAKQEALIALLENADLLGAVTYEQIDIPSGDIRIVARLKVIVE